MKRRYWIILTGALLIMTFSVPAMATTGICMDGNTYVFSGDQSTFEADGKTFIIGENSVRIKEAGQPDRVLPMVTSADDSVGTADATAGSVSTATSEDVSVVTEGSGASVSTIADACTTSEGTSVKRERDNTYGRYASFGMSYDAAQDALYYQGHRVRIFEDAYSLSDKSDNISVAVSHFDESGTIDVEAQRNQTVLPRNADGFYDPSKGLTGLHMLSDVEFTTRDLTQWTQPSRYEATSASSESPMTAEEAEAFYTPYAEFGLVYDAKTDCLIYQGQTVHTFLDIKKTNGESLSGGCFQGTITSQTNNSGTLDVTTIRDYTDPDVEGNGKLTGMKVEKVK